MRLSIFCSQWPNIWHLTTHFRLASGTIVKSTYGFDILSNDDAFNKLAIEAFTAVFSLGLNGLTSLDLVPLCEQIMVLRAFWLNGTSVRYLPPWLPGMGILQRGKDARVLIDKMVDEPYEHVKERRVGHKTFSPPPVLTSSAEIWSWRYFSRWRPTRRLWKNRLHRWETRISYQECCRTNLWRYAIWHYSDATLRSYWSIVYIAGVETVSLLPRFHLIGWC